LDSHKNIDGAVFAWSGVAPGNLKLADNHVWPLSAFQTNGGVLRGFGSDTGGFNGFQQIISLTGPNHDQQPGKDYQKLIRNLYVIAGIFVALGVSAIGGVLQFLGLRALARKNPYAVLIWLTGLALGFAGPLGILWGII